MKVNGVPLDLLEPELLRVKVFEPLLLLPLSASFLP